MRSFIISVLFAMASLQLSQMLYADEQDTETKPSQIDNSSETDKKPDVILTPAQELQLVYQELTLEIEEFELSIHENLQSMQNKTGEELTAAELRQFQKGQSLVKTYIQLIDNIIQQEQQGVDTSQLIEQVSPELLAVNNRITEAMKTEEITFNQRIKLVDENSDHFFLRFKKHYNYQSIALSALVDFNQSLRKLKLNKDSINQTLHRYLKNHAENLAGKIQVLAEKKTQFESGITASQAPSQQQKILNQRFQIIEESLKQVIKLLSGEGLDAANYQRILIEATGTITKDVLDITVAAGLIEDWTTNLEDTIKENGIDYIFKSVLFFLIIFTFWLASKLVGRILYKSLNSTGAHNNNLMQNMVVGLTTRLIIFLGVLFALSQMGVSLGPVLTGLGIAGFIVGFALQDTLGNFASGIMILIYRPYDVGDVVEVGGKVFGSVNSMNLVSTTIMTFDNQTLVLPNSKIWGDVIKNITDQDQRRVDLVFHAPLTSDVDTMIELYRQCTAANNMILKEPEVIIRLHKITFNSLEFIVRPWVKTEDYWAVHWGLHEEIKRCYDQNNIYFPVHQSHVRLENDT